MKKYFAAAGATALVLFAASAATGQEPRDTFQLDDLVVSVARLPLERAASTASVTVLHANELRLKGIRTVGDALRSIAGTAFSQSGSYGAFASLFMRGGESDYVQVLLDGIQVNSPGEHFDFGNLTLENIERIEVVRGPVSVLYGSDAMTGVVQLFSKKGNTRPHFDIAASSGLGNRRPTPNDRTFGSSALDGQLRGQVGRLSYSAGVSHFRSEGAYAFNNENRNTGVTTRIAFAPDAQTELAGTARLSRNEFHFPTDGAGNVVDTNQQNVADGITAGLEAGRRFGPRLEARAVFGFNRNDDTYSDRPDNAGDTLGFYAYRSDERFQKRSADMRLNYSFAARSVFTLGLDFDTQRERGSSLAESQFGPFPGTSAESRGNRATYAQLIGNAARIDYQAGVRVDDNDRFGTFVTYRGGMSARVLDGLRLRASAGTGFKQPRFFEQFATGFVKGNPALEPETSTSLEAGAEMSSQGARLATTVFRQRFRNLIQYVGMPAGPDDPNYRNLAGARADGVEVEVMRPIGSVRAQASYTLLRTEVTNDGTGDDPLFAAGQTLIRRPRHSGTIGLGYARDTWNAFGTLNYVGERADLDFNDFPANRVILEAYARFDLAGEVALGRAGLKGTAKIENVFNEGYEEARNFPARRRVAFVGMRYGR